MTYWVPFVAVPTAATSGTSGVFLIPSNNVSAAKTFVSNTVVYGQYLTQYMTDSGNNIVQSKISEAIYVTESGTNDHLFSLALGDISTTPTPTQIGSLTLNLSTTPADRVCAISIFNQTLNTPSSAMMLVLTAGDEPPQLEGECENPESVLYVVHASDSPSTPPVIAPPMDGVPAPLYDANTGDLDGLLYLDKNQNLIFSDTAFANPATLLSGVSTFSELYAGQGSLFAVIEVNGKTSLYRITPGAISSDLYDFQPTGTLSGSTYTSSEAIATYDSAEANLWISDNVGVFDDNTDNLDSYSDNLIRVPLSGSSPGQVIYTTSGSLKTGVAAYYAIDPVGFIGSNFVFNLQASANPYVQGPGPQLQGTPGTPASLDTLPTASTAGTQPVVIESLAGGYFDGNYLANGTIFHTAYAINSQGAGTSVTVEALNSSGTVLQSFANSLILGTLSQSSGTPLTPINSIPTIYVGEGYAGFSSGTGGATIYALSTSSLNQVPLTLPDSSPFTVSTQSFPAVISGNLPLSPENFYGQYEQSDFAAVLNTANNVWTPFANPSNTELGPFNPAY